MNIKDIDAVILCGGLGTRLRSVVKDRPKSMALVKQKPFLDILIKYLSKSGLRNFILGIGYKGDFISDYYRAEPGALNIKFSIEKAPLGTGGAAKKALSMTKSSPVLVLNGDSLCKIDIKKFLSFHLRHRALASLVLIPNRMHQDCGYVKMLKSGLIKSFDEKCKGRQCKFISAGIYLFDKKVINFMPKKRKFSLEYDLFPRLTNNKFYGYKADSAFVHIGTPKGLKHAGRHI